MEIEKQKTDMIIFNPKKRLFKKSFSHLKY